jgi:ABC-2 type transporter
LYFSLSNFLNSPEPTSGLDSQSSYNIIKFIRKLADAGMPLVCTIHQPSSVLFEYFDRLLLLGKGGKVTYFGDIGKNSRTLLDYFERNGARTCTQEENPAEYLLEAIGAGLCIYLFVYLFVCLFIYLFVYLFVCLFICLFVYLFVCLFVCLFIYLFVYLFVCLFICLFIYLF